MICIQLPVERGLGEVSFAIVEENVAASSKGVNDQIEVAVAIDVGEAGAGGIQAGAANPGGGGYIFEMPVAEIAEEMTASTETSEEEIAPSVTVDVARGNTGTVQENLI